MSPRFEDKNVMDLFTTDVPILQMIYDEALRLCDTNDQGDLIKSILLSVVYPDNQKVSPFDKTIKSLKPKSIKLMIDMLLMSPGERTSKFVRKHFDLMSQLNVPNFEAYLESCLFTHIKDQKTLSIPWNFEEKEVYIDYHSSYIGKDFYSKLKVDQTQEDSKAPDVKEELKTLA